MFFTADAFNAVAARHSAYRAARCRLVQCCPIPSECIPSIGRQQRVVRAAVRCQPPLVTGRSPIALPPCVLLLLCLTLALVLVLVRLSVVLVVFFPPGAWKETATLSASLHIFAGTTS